jgi:ribosomal protein L11 methylase PrmA
VSVRLLTGDAMEMLAPIEPASISVCVTDPPYGLKFMGRAWDHGVPGVPYWQAVYRVLKPGAWLLAFGGTRTYHRLTCAIEDAGFEIRDCLMWLYGSGFPKGKGCLKPGWEPIALARKKGPLWLNVDDCRLAPLTKAEIARSGKSTKSRIYDGLSPVDWKRDGAPAAGRWPANVVLSHEPECRERAPSNGAEAFDAAERTLTGEPSPMICVESCAVRMLDEQSERLMHGAGYAQGPQSKWAYDVRDTPVYGSGRIAAGGARYGDVGGASRFFFVSSAKTEGGIINACESVSSAESTSSQPRPSGVSAHDPVRADHSLEADSQELSTSGTRSESEPISATNTPAIQSTETKYLPESPRASTVKTALANGVAQLGLTDITMTTGSHSTSDGCVGPAISSSTQGNSAPEAAALPIETEGATRFLYCSKASTAERGPGNDWPTVKPLALMSWLVKLVTPRGGTILDPFCGSGSTLIAADRLGFDSIGIDSDPHAIEIARGRLQADAGPMFADQVVAS